MFAFAAEIVSHDRSSGFKYDLRRSVILLEPDDARVRKIFFEFQDVANVCAAPRIDALVFITDSTHILGFACEQLHQFILGPVRVLILIYQ